MVQARIVAKHGTSKRFLEEIPLPERPRVGSEIDGRYKVISVSEPVPIGTNLSAGEPVMGIEICVEKLQPKAAE